MGGESFDSNITSNLINNFTRDYDKYNEESPKVPQEPVSVWLVDYFGNNDGKVSQEDFDIIDKFGIKSPYSDKCKQLYRDIVEYWRNVFNKAESAPKTESEPPMVEEIVTGNQKKCSAAIQAPNGTVTKYSETFNLQTEQKLSESKSVVSKDENGNVHVKSDVTYYSETGKKLRTTNAEYTYNREKLEDYIINTKTQGKDLRFKSIPVIKNKPESERTDSEKALLNEFNNMVDMIISTSEDYGVDPHIITAIIRQETKFDGLSKAVANPRRGANGYMQITKVPIQDYLGITGSDKVISANKNKFGPEMYQLLKSRGFDPDTAKSRDEKEDLVNKIFKYLQNNSDPEFNIRMGTLILRQYAFAAKGNYTRAALNYNGNKKIISNGKEFRQYYADSVKTFFDDMSKMAGSSPSFIIKKY